MDVSVPIVTCSSCHQEVRSTDYFCFNCGKNLKPKPLPTDVPRQLMYYLGSILFPPMGLIWGLRYLKEESNRGRIIGVVCIVLNCIVMILAVLSTVRLINMINDQVNSQMETMIGF